MPNPMVEDENGCWIGAPSSFEVALAAPFANQALERFRRRLFAVVTTNGATDKSARVVLQMAHETDVRVAMVKMITLAADVMRSTVCQRRRYLDVDAAVRLHGHLVLPAFDAFAQLKGIPTSYVDFLKRYATSASAKHRVSALAGLVCLAKAVTA